MANPARHDPLGHEGFNVDDIKIHSAEVIDKPTLASPFKGPVEIIVEAHAWEVMHAHAREDMRHEAGGIMLGEIYQWEGGTAVRITTAVPARQAVQDLASLQFTYSAWSQMERERQKTAPTEKLVGWYHTHPGFSAFFSSTDLFMHQHFFSQPWHVGLVIDPINHEQRFYRWESGQVVEVTDYLLQVAHGGGPQPPLASILSSALRHAARQLEGQSPTEPSRLAPALLKLVHSLPSRATDTSTGQLLPFLVAASELPIEALAEARRQLEVQVAPESPIRATDLAVASNNTNPAGAISIAQGWLAQQRDRETLHLHALDESQTYCAELTLPWPIRDLAIDEAANLLTLSQDQERLLVLLDPPLPVLRTVGRKTPGQLFEKPLPVDWEGRRPSGPIGKMINAQRTLYLLARDELFVLSREGNRTEPRYRCLASYPAQVCGWDAFSQLTSWTVDVGGNLYLLRSSTKETWRFDRLLESWSQFAVVSEAVQPVSLAAGMTALSVYDAGNEPAVLQYSISDARLLCRRRLELDLKGGKIWHLFSDGYQKLYLVTDRYVYQTI